MKCINFDVIPNHQQNEWQIGEIVAFPDTCMSNFSFVAQRFGALAMYPFGCLYPTKSLTLRISNAQRQKLAILFSSSQSKTDLLVVSSTPLSLILCNMNVLLFTI